MYITSESDYAVRIVYCLAKCNCRKDAKLIADETGVTLRFSLKILRKLVDNGIIKSFKGAQGGYELAKTADNISLKDVIEVIEGPVIISRCLDENYNCSHFMDGHCKFQRIFDEASTLVKEKFDSVKFSQLIAE